MVVITACAATSGASGSIAIFPKASVITSLRCIVECDLEWCLAIRGPDVEVGGRLRWRAVIVVLHIDGLDLALPIFVILEVGDITAPATLLSAFIILAVRPYRPAAGDLHGIDLAFGLISEAYPETEFLALMVGLSI